MSNPPLVRGSSILAVSGAKYSNRKSIDEAKDRSIAAQRAAVAENYVLSSSAPQQPQPPSAQQFLSSNNSTSAPTRSDSTTSEILSKGLYSNANAGDAVGSNKTSDRRGSDAQSVTDSKYWKFPPAKTVNGQQQGQASTSTGEDLVVIHVCDENQQISKDFCCKRDILIQHMRYFQKFLNETENGYDDIDISVHCDVEIFEWLMNYIHEPLNPPKMDKSILISILISSEFLQMEPLVELCINQVSQSLNEIIKLPIDLSCISEKLVNRIASISSPKALSEIKDRKDKILTKLYKRRVELDFSRKGSASKTTTSASAPRTIAASLTCCRHCGWVYLENYSSFLTCRKSQPSINYRGRLASRHSAILGWSLTSYLKTLHSGGMGWDAIYWHVWAACIVLRVEDIVISALETDRYGVEPEGLLIKGNIPRDNGTDASGNSGGASSWQAMLLRNSRGSTGSSGGSSNTNYLSTGRALEYTLDMDIDAFLSTNSNSTNNSGTGSGIATTSSSLGSASISGAGFAPAFKMSIVSPHGAGYPVAVPGITTSLNPLRSPEILTLEIYQLLCSQMKYITGLQHKNLIDQTMQAMVLAAAKADNMQNNSSGVPNTTAVVVSGANSALHAASTSGNDVFVELQALEDEDNRLYGGATNSNTNAEDERRRGRSPARSLAYPRLYSASQEPRTKAGSSSSGTGKQRSSTVGPTVPFSNNNTGSNISQGIALSDGTSTNATATTSAHATSSSNNSTGNNSGNGTDNDNDTPNDSDAEGPPAGGGNSSSGGNGHGGGGAGGNKKAATRYHSQHEQQQQRSASATASRGRSSSVGKRGSVSTSSTATLSKGAVGLPPKAKDALRGRHGQSIAHGTAINASGDVDDLSNGADDLEDLVRLHEILRSLPADLAQRAQQQRGAVYGAWMVPCALTWQPGAMDEMLTVVEDSHLPEHKKLEWSLDVMREYDEKRMDKLGRWLLQKRNPVHDQIPHTQQQHHQQQQQSSNRGGSNAKGGNAVASGGGAGGGKRGGSSSSYYKDRARQPYRCVI